MSRGCSFGGGQSSLGYLFESDDPQNLPPMLTKTVLKPQSSIVETTKAKGKPQSYSSTTTTNATATNTIVKHEKTDIYNTHHRPQGQSSGNIITGRPSTRVQSVPGGSSSLGYLFGDEKQKD